MSDGLRLTYNGIGNELTVWSDGARLTIRKKKNVMYMR